MSKWVWWVVVGLGVGAPLAFVAEPAVASEGSADATAVLEAFVDLQLDAMGSLLAAMDTSAGKAGRKVGDASATIDQARAAKNEAEKLRQGGNSEEAAKKLAAAFKTISPGVKAWSRKAPTDQRRTVANELVGAVGETLSVVDKHMAGLPETVKTHYTAAKSIHTEAQGMIASDPQGAWSREVDALQELNQLVMALKVHRG